jgi:hypothetical protein
VRKGKKSKDNRELERKTPYNFEKNVSQKSEVNVNMA